MQLEYVTLSSFMFFQIEKRISVTTSRCIFLKTFCHHLSHAPTFRSRTSRNGCLIWSIFLREAFEFVLIFDTPKARTQNWLFSQQRFMVGSVPVALLNAHDCELSVPKLEWQHFSNIRDVPGSKLMEIADSKQHPSVPDSSKLLYHKLYQWYQYVYCIPIIYNCCKRNRLESPADWSTQKASMTSFCSSYSTSVTAPKGIQQWFQDWERLISTKCWREKIQLNSYETSRTSLCFSIYHITLGPGLMHLASRSFVYGVPVASACRNQT